LNPNNATLLANYGHQLLEFGKVDEAISQIRQALALNSEYFFPYYCLGLAYRKKRDEKQATKEFGRARDILRDVCISDPQDEHYLDFLVWTERALGNYDEADKARKHLENIRHEKILGGSPEELLAGPESRAWMMEDAFEKSRQNQN
jgi:tetratricopeptide (TPR) repeat protein